MSFETNVRNLATRVASECKSLRTLINGNAVDLSGLSTVEKGNLVLAINELVTDIAELESSAAGINDAVTAGTSTWSSQKTSDQLTALKAEILGGAGAAYDTLAELKALLDTSDAGDDAAIAAINAALGNRLRVDAAQGLTGGQQQQGRDNLDVYSKAEVGDVTRNFVTDFEAGLV